MCACVCTVCVHVCVCVRACACVVWACVCVCVTVCVSPTHYNILSYHFNSTPSHIQKDKLLFTSSLKDPVETSSPGSGESHMSGKLELPFKDIMYVRCNHV